MSKKMVLLRTGEESAFPGEVTHSSEQTPWAGFPIESRRLSGQGSVAEFTVPSGCLALCVRGRSQIVLETPAEKRNFEFSPGKLSTGRPGSHYRKLAWKGEYEAISLQLSAPRLPLL